MEYRIIAGELQHHGIKGMRWGVRRFQNPNGTLTNAGKKRYQDRGRQTSARESVESKKLKVEAARTEAANRIKFYGGKNVATNAIKQEAAYQTKVEAGKAAVRSFMSTVGACTVAAAANAGTTSAAIALTGAGGGIVISAAVAAKAISYIKRHADEQIAYTKDSEYGADVVVGKKRED